MPEPSLNPPDEKRWKCPICSDYEDGCCILMTEYGIDHESAEMLSHAASNCNVEALNRWLQGTEYNKLDYQYFSNQRREFAEVKRVVEFLRMVADHIEDNMPRNGSH